MKALGKLISAAAVLLAVLNMLGGISSGIWLAVLGDWWAIVPGVFGLFVTHHILGFALLPAALFAVPAEVALRRRHNGLAYLALVLSQLYTGAIITLWCTFVMYWFVTRSESGNIVPLLIFSYGVATGPLAFLAHHEQKSGGGEGAVVATVAAELAYIAAGLAVLVSPISIIGVCTIIGVVMAACAFLQSAAAISALRADAALAVYETSLHLE